MRIAITGASGLIGSALSAHLTELGHEPVPVVRRKPSDNEIGWSVAENRIDDGAFDGIDGVVISPARALLTNGGAIRTRTRFAPAAPWAPH